MQEVRMVRRISFRPPRSRFLYGCTITLLLLRLYVKRTAKKKKKKKWLSKVVFKNKDIII